MKSEIFTITFKKKLKKENVIEKLSKDFNNYDENTYKDFAKELLQGETCTIVGRMIKIENHFGRSTIIDLKYGYGGLR